MKFKYTSTCLSSPTLGDGTKVKLFPGAVVELPEANGWVKSAVHRGLLVPVVEPVVEETVEAKSTPKSKNKE